MHISITAVTSKRQFTKAMFRHADAIAQLKGSASGIDTSGLPFDVFQLVLVDSEDETDARVLGCKGDRLFQVEVPTPDAEAVDFRDASAFVRYIAQQLEMAVKLADLPEGIESQLSGIVDQYIRK